MLVFSHTINGAFSFITGFLQDDYWRKNYALLCLTLLSTPPDLTAFPLYSSSLSEPDPELEEPLAFSQANIMIRRTTTSATIPTDGYKTAILSFTRRKNTLSELSKSNISETFTSDVQIVLIILLLKNYVKFLIIDARLLALSVTVKTFFPGNIN